MTERNRIEIGVWMDRNGWSVAKIQAALGYETHTGISNTLAGRRHLRKVLRLLLAEGCPAELLALPEDMKKAA
ncbi:MAG: hypothetical protein OEY01_10890 [Desulfobulbaceae bacterium]|nr:hypothetical protein [Desulfobulbaceae bacterium]